MEKLFTWFKEHLLQLVIHLLQPQELKDQGLAIFITIWIEDSKMVLPIHLVVIAKLFHYVEHKIIMINVAYSRFNASSSWKQFSFAIKHSQAHAGRCLTKLGANQYLAQWQWSSLFHG